MAKPETVRSVLERLRASGVAVHYEPLPEMLPIEWSALRDGVDPHWGGLPDGRLQRKRRQLESLFAVVRALARGGQRIVDFGSSSGHVGLPLACLLPDCEVTLVDLKPVPLRIASARIEAAGLRNVHLYCGELARLAEPFDLGIGLHVCGDGTDQVLELCLRRRAAYVLCPCDLGELRRSPLLYPRSERLRELISREEFNQLARAGDWTNWTLADEKCQLAWEASGWIALDRNGLAEEHGYRTHLYTINPAEAGLKSVILAGEPGRSG